MNDFDRRQALQVGGAAMIGATAMGSAPSASAAAVPRVSLDEPLLNFARAYDEMERTNVDALVCALPQNIYYLTNHYPLLSRMGVGHSAYAILLRDQTRKPLLIIGHFSYYYTVADDQISRFADVSLYTAPSDSDAVGLLEQQADPGQMPQLHDSSLQQAKERARREAVMAVTRDVSASGEQALLRALADFGAGLKTVAVDDQAIGQVLSAGGLDVKTINGETLIRSIRLQKSPAELSLARYAADANARAGLAAAKTARDGAMISEVRAAYAAECIKRGLQMEFMVVDRVSSPIFDAPLVDGQAFLIDCVSQFHHYHGDYGRTIFLGEATQKMKAATTAMGRIWDQVRSQLRPGIRYSDIRAMAAKAIKETRIDANIICNPHSVGMFHTDEPSASDHYSFKKPDLVVKENMVLSIDIAMIDAGLGGSAHLEDLMLITKDGAEPLNDIGDRVITI
jgi:Xaa-Pro aminopeptidase